MTARMSVNSSQANPLVDAMPGLNASVRKLDCAATRSTAQLTISARPATVLYVTSLN
jgi:hypothetical protein